MVRLFIRWITARLHVCFELLHCARDQRRSVAVAPDKLGWRRKTQIYQIVEYQYLAIAIRPGPDADGWRSHFLRDHGCDFPRYALQNNGEHACAVESYRVLN